MKILTLTNMWPQPGAPQFGIFVQREVESLRRAGIEVDVMFINGRLSRLNYLRGIWRLRARLEGSAYDLIHAHYVLSGVVARAQKRVPVVLTHHGIEVMRGWQAPLSWTLSRGVNQVIVQSEPMRERLGLADAHVIPTGIDLDLFRPRPKAEARREMGLSADGHVVLFVGEARPEKRLDLAQAAVARLGPEVQLVHVSNQSPQAVARFMNAADVLVLPSDHEGSPCVVKEALACNLPVVATPVGDVPGLIGTVTGCHLIRQSPDSIAAAIRRALRRGAPVEGRQTVTDLTWDIVARRLAGVYEVALA